MEGKRTCPACKNAMVSKRVEHPYWKDNILVAIIHNVPSWVCELCGHRVFEPAVETTLSVLVKDYIKLGKTFPIPSTSYRPLSLRTS